MICPINATLTELGTITTSTNTRTTNQASNITLGVSVANQDGTSNYIVAVYAPTRIVVPFVDSGNWYAKVLDPVTFAGVGNGVDCSVKLTLLTH